MSFVKAEKLYRMAEMANARRHGISLRLVMEEFHVEERTARRMLRKFEDLFGGVETWDDTDRRRWWSLHDVPYIQHRVLRENEPAVLDLGIRRAEQTVSPSRRPQQQESRSSTCCHQPNGDAARPREFRTACLPRIRHAVCDVAVHVPCAICPPQAGRWKTGGYT